MAAGKRMLPGAAVMTERAVTAEQQMMTGRQTITGQHSTGQSADTGWVNRPGEPAGYSSDPRADQPQRTVRRGAGGRWLVWMLRGFLWIVLLLIAYRGVVAIVTGNQSPGGQAGTASGPAATTGGYPVSLAGAFALEFGQIYLNFSPATAAQRAAELAPFLPPGADPQLGWNGSGSQTVQSVQVAGVDVRGARSAVVDLLALANGHLIEIGVPVYYSGGGLVVSGQPALLPPPVAAVPPALAQRAADPGTARALGALLPKFFRAFARGNTAKLGTFAAPGTQLTGLNGEVAFGGIVTIGVPAGGQPASGTGGRAITVTVAWLPVSTPSAGPPSAAGGRAQIDMTYAMTVEHRAGRWYVGSIGALTPPAGSSS
ncbi:MAG TPA: conjugal transfer protein [Streptosporangiaceae bacterium]|nr:conjugal transfer protein [Streptosporangiaceae bacterium]